MWKWRTLRRTQRNPRASMRNSNIKGSDRSGRAGKDTENERPNEGRRKQGGCGSTEVKIRVQVNCAK